MMAGELTNRTTGATIEASFHNSVKDRTVMRYASEAERASLIPTPVEGDIAYLEDTNELTQYDGSGWLTYIEDTATTDTVTPTDGNGNMTLNLRKVGKTVTGYFTVVTNSGGTPLPSGQATYTATIPAAYRPSQTYMFPAFVISGSTVQDNVAAFAIYSSGTVIKLNIINALSTGDEMRATMTWLTS